MLFPCTYRTRTGMQPKMENQKVQKMQCDMKTDLNLLLECLKYRMDCPSSQKETLITIYSICQQNSEACEYLREIGGLEFINDLAKSSVHGIVKEAALFTLGIVIESNVYCQQTLCSSALFEELTLFLTNKDSDVNLKRMSVYVILALVSNNKLGQTYVRETGCIDLLLQLFRTTLCTPELNLSDENTNSCYQLWSSVCSTLCACVNNPQNEANQKICCSVFPYAKEWLESCMEPEIVRPICSFVGLTVANNSLVQKYFVSVGGLDTLAQVLIKLMHDDSCLSHSSTKLAIVVTKTLDACIANDSAMTVVLAKYHTVSELLNLLSNDTLDTGEKMSVILTIGHCTEVCEENQCELLKNHGLSLMIQVLTESQDEELHKAATFVLQNCKQMTEQLSLKINEKSTSVKNAEELEVGMQIRERSQQNYWKKAKDILHRINLIEKEHDEISMFMEEGAEGRLFDRSSEDSIEASKSREVNPSDTKACIERTCKELCGPQLTSKMDDRVLALAINSSALTVNPVKASARKSKQNYIPRSVYEMQSDTAIQSHSVNEKTACEKSQSFLQERKGLLQQPVKTIKHMKWASTSDQHSFYSEIAKEAKSNLITTASLKMSDFMCLGCTTTGLSLNSRTFSKMLQTCPYLCGRHRVILEAEERYKKKLQKSSDSNKRHAAYEKIVLTPVKKGKLLVETSLKSKQDNFQSKALTWKLVQKHLLSEQFSSRASPQVLVDRSYNKVLDSVQNLSDNVHSIIVKLLHYFTIKFSGTLLNPSRITFVPPAIFCFVLMLKM
ncbi:telomere repeats-binding bouquet formation protein 1 isoform X2 [Meleagris gallopavo]|uniref:telomere repeats-binding bouquet formation protein 1 isoform X2 n=1 Tax=Meleagris gallopavo TaxID=9103 RepID=UPI00093ACB49|nr:telomere repeats-binding bouquet formation protein 1 isoform X2 [Meleagris gallopavo]